MPFVRPFHIGLVKLKGPKIFIESLIFFHRRLLARPPSPRAKIPYSTNLVLEESHPGNVSNTNLIDRDEDRCNHETRLQLLSLAAAEF